MERIEQIISGLKKLPNDIRGLDTCEEISEKDLKLLESKIKYTFPDGFRYFLLKYNGISIPGDYIYGIKKKKDTVFDLYELYLLLIDKSNRNPMPEYLIPFCPNGRGDYYCFNTKNNKIYFWQHDCIDYTWNPDFDCNSFSERLEKNIKESLEVLK